MTISREMTQIQPFWSLSFPASQEDCFKGSLHDAAQNLERLLTDAVRIRLRADVPVAAYLSGGLDSSATTALIKKVAPESLQTFSIGFEDGEFDETPFQQEVSKYLEYKAYRIYLYPGRYWQLFPAGGMAFRNPDFTNCSCTHVLPFKKGQGKQY